MPGMTKNKQPEKEVQDKCIDRLDYWKSVGVVIDYDDVSNLGRKQTRTGFVMNTKKGKRDIIAFLKVKETAWLYLIECKAPTGGVWAEDQQEYAAKFDSLLNVFYEVVSDAKQIDKTIERITGYAQSILDRIEF